MEMVLLRREWITFAMQEMLVGPDSSCSVGKRAGETLQFISTRTRRNHFPVVAALKSGPFFPSE
eukprot:1820565-Pyramimonas_sp.AAC.1